MRLPLLIPLFFFTFNVLSARPVEPPDKSGTAFYGQCAVVEQDISEDSRADAMNRGYCLGYVAGLTQGTNSAEAIHDMKNATRILCLPPGVSNIQKVRIIRKYIGNHPEEAHNPAQRLALTALHEAFPCNDK